MGHHFLYPLFHPTRILCIECIPLASIHSGLVSSFKESLALGKVESIFINLASPVQTPFPKKMERVDLSVIQVPPSKVKDALALTQQSGGSLAILFTYGSKAETTEWFAYAQQLGIKILGPGSSGIQRPHLGLNLAHLGPCGKKGQIALVSQSSALVTALLDWANANDIGFSCVLSLGHANGVGIDEVLDFLITDSNTQSVIIQLEELHEARHFLSALRALSSVKPVIVLYPGSLSNTSHTYGEEAQQTLIALNVSPPSSDHSFFGESIFSVDSALSAALRRSGAIQVNFLMQLYSATRCLSLQNPPQGRKLALISNGWGPARLAEHRARQNRLQLPNLAGLTLTSGHQIYGINPLDLGPEATPADYAELVEMLAKHPQVDGIVTLLAPRPQVDLHKINQALINTKNHLTKPLIVSWLGDEVGAQLRTELIAANIPAFRSPETAIDGYANLARFYRNQQLALQIPGTLAEQQALLHQDFAAVRAICADHLGKNDECELTHAESLALLAQGGIIVPAMSNQNMPIASDIAVALYISVVTHPLLGPVLLTGSLAQPAALTQDRATELPPMNGYIAQRMIERTRIAHWLQQQHDLAPHLATWEALLAQVGEMVAAIPEIDALDLQPLWLSATGLSLWQGQGQVRLRLKKRTGIANHTAIAPYPRHLQRTLSLRADTEPCELRPIHPGDAHALQQFVRALSPQARYMRFISALSELTPRMLVRYTQIDYDREMALVAVLPKNGGMENQIIGVVRYLLNNDRTSCEYAIAIADDWQHQGLGTALMKAIIDCARRKGLARIEGYILANNTPMLGLLRKLNFQIETDLDDPAMRLVSLALQ